MMRDNRIKYYTPADYTEGSELDVLVKAIIDRTVSNEALESIHYSCKREHRDMDMQSDLAQQKKINLIIALSDSHSFARTHSVIEELSAYTHWTNRQLEGLFFIAVNNSQVQCILGDDDVNSFFGNLLSVYEGDCFEAKELASMLGK